MGKRVFFSFHYQDVAYFRANVVRNHWLTKPNRESAGYYDASVWETAKKEGPIAVKRLINSSLFKTSVTCVLIGSQTYNRPWVRYEILKSFLKGNYIFGVHINSIKDRYGQTKPHGLNPFNFVGVSYSQDGKTGTLWIKNQNRWVKYTEIDGKATFAANVGANYRNKIYDFTQIYKVYDWIANVGYNNFSKWVNNG